MAKRRRLTPPELASAVPQSRPGLSFDSGAPAMASARPPVAQMAGAAANHAAFDEVARALETARAEGRLAIPLPLDLIAEDHLVRDRIAFDADEMTALEQSLSDRGQQTPIEVVALDGGRYGLISGWRRITALRRLGQDSVLAVVRRPDTAAEAYRAMVEENEIRSGISYWERANVAVGAAGLGVYPDVSAAIAGLFSSASRAKRSKIGSFAALVPVLGGALKFPTAIPERTGLALVAALEREGFVGRLKDALRKGSPTTAEAERAILERALKKTGKDTAPAGQGAEVGPGVFLKTAKGRAVLSGPGVNEALLRDLGVWLAGRG